MSEISAPDQDNARSLHNQQVRYLWAHQVVKNYALEVCQLLFSDEANPLGLVWKPDGDESQILIVDKHAFNLDHVATSPAIVANRGPVAWGKSSGFRQLEKEDFRTGRRTYKDIVRGGVTLSCFSRSGLEAENIAGFVFEAINSLRDVLRKLARQGMMASHLGFFKVEAATMGEEALIKSGSRPELSVVPVALRAIVQRRWSVEPSGAAKLINLTTRTSRGGTAT